MAQKVTVTLTDDLDPDVEATQTVTFSIDGSSFAIDLSDSNASKLREAFAPWVAHARKANGTSRRLNGTALRRPRADKEQLAAIRSWAQSNGYAVSDRGRIPADVVSAYHQRSNGKTLGEQAVEAAVTAAVIADAAQRASE